MGGIPAEGRRALTSNDLFLDDANVLVPVWLQGGRGDRPAFPIGRNRIFVYVPNHRGKVDKTESGTGPDGLLEVLTSTLTQTLLEDRTRTGLE